MQTEPTSNKGLLEVSNGGRWGERRSWSERTGCKRRVVSVPQPWLTVLDNVIQEAARRVRGREGNAPSRQWYKTSQGEAHLFKDEARRVIEAVEAGASDDAVLALGEAFVAWTERVLASRRNLTERRGLFSDESQRTA